MGAFVIKCFAFVPEGNEDCSVRAWLHDYDEKKIAKRNRPAIVICPGGGYGYVSKREAEPVAAVYFAAGYDTAKLKLSSERS